MPVKHKRNGLSRKQRLDPNSIVYSTSMLSQFSDTPSTSAASSPPDPPPAFTLDTEPPMSDPEPDAVRETMTDNIDPPDCAVGYAKDPSDLRGEDKSADLCPPTSPPKPTEEPALEEQTLLVDISELPERGHVRSPILAREPSSLESFSRTIRTYVPSSIPIPSVVPTPPRVSRPVSFGSFLTPSRAGSSAQRTGSDTDRNSSKRRGSDVSSGHQRTMTWRERQWPTDEVEEAVFNLDEEIREDERSSTLRPTPTTYPSTTNGEDVVCATFGSVMDGDNLRRLIMLGYRNGLQIWDCTNLGSAAEVLNLSGARWGTVEVLSVLPDPRSVDPDDPFKAQRPLIGFLSNTGNEKAFIAYSLRAHEVVKKINIPSLVSFTASSEFIVLSTAEPPTLHVLLSRTFHTLYTFPPAAFALFSHRSPIPDIHDSVSLSVEQDGDSVGPSHGTIIPQPIFALSQRLIAFASAPPRPSSPTQSSARTPRTASQSPFDDGGLKFPMTQAELGFAALKIGGNLFSGMKAIGGRAYSAARAGVSAAMSADHHGANPVTPVPGKFFSRSAPEASSRGHERRHSIVSDAGSQTSSVAGDAVHASTLLPSLPEQIGSKSHGYYVTVMDLEPLCSKQCASPTPALLAEYMVSMHQPISEIEFSPDGTSLVIALKDGQTMKVYRLHPPSKILRTEAASAGVSSNERSVEAGLHSDHDHSLTCPPWHIYDLRRGRTSAVVEQFSWAHDGRWLAVGTRKRTIHLFALNPYGGPTDEASHLEGRVVNVGEIQPLSTELTPLVRLRLKPHPDDHLHPAFVFTFLPSYTNLPLSVAPPAAPPSHSISSSPSSAHSSSPGHPSELPVNHQDILVFDPRDGILSLRRVTISKRFKDDFSATIRAVPIANASISLPGVSNMGRLASASSASGPASRQPSALSRMMERSELVGQDAVVATWLLRRSLDWQEIKRPFRSRQNQRSASRRTKSEWLAQAELSTCSRSRKIVPKSIYLAHQFSFHYLGEDYHALLRSHRFDVPAHKVDVRRQIAVSASSTGMSESFVSGSSVPSQGGGFSSSFDEPLASALSAELRYLNPSPPVLPMYPNGPTSTRASVRAAIPIRVAAGISDGMSEGLGRLRREIGRVRSPKPSARGGHPSSVPLEFDEEDEDFLGLDPSSDSISRSTSREGEVLSTPSTGLEPLPAEHEDDGAWQGWEAEDKEAVEEVEQFDDIGVGFMDEEWMRNTK